MERIKYSSISMILIFASAFLITLVLIPKYQVVSKLKVSLSDFEKALTDQREYFKEINQDLEKLKDYEDSMDKISLAIPKEPSMAIFFNLIENLASANGLYLKDVGSFDISQSKEIPEIKEIKTSFSVSGSFTAFKNFIFALERSAEMVKIENISFRSETKTEKTPTETFDFSFGVKIYSF